MNEELLTEEEIFTLLSAMRHRADILKATGDYPEREKDLAICTKLLKMERMILKHRNIIKGKLLPGQPA
jgi:hypothetical protein